MIFTLKIEICNISYYKFMLLYVYASSCCLFVCLFWVAQAIFQLSGDCHHCRRQGCKFSPMLSAYSFQQWGFFYVPHLLRHGTSVFKVISERPVILTSKCWALGEGAIPTYFHVLGLTRPGAEHGARTHDLPITRRELYQLSHRDAWPTFQKL